MSVLDEKYLAARYTGHDIIGLSHFGQTNIGKNNFERCVVFSLNSGL